MSRLEGGPWMVSSSSRSCFRSRSRPGAWRDVPAPAGVPVDRRVRIGFVRPFTVRPVSGVCDRVSSRPLPPARRGLAGRVLRGEGASERGFCRVDGTFPRDRGFWRVDEPACFRADFRAPLVVDLAAFRVPALSDPVFRRVEGVAFFRRAFPCGVLAPAVLRLPPRLWAIARAPAPALRFEGVFFWPRDLPLGFAFFFVLAISSCRRNSEF